MKTLVRIFFGVLIWLEFFLVCDAVGQSTEPKNLKQEARGLLSYPLTMAQSVETGDLFSVEKSSFDTVTRTISEDGQPRVTGILIDEKKSIRSFFDFKTERFLCVTLIEGKIVDFDGGAEKRIHEWSLGHADFGENTLTRFGHDRAFSKTAIGKLSRPEVFHLIGYPEFRVGWFSSRNDLNSFTELRSFIDKRTADSLDSVSPFRIKIKHSDVDTTLSLIARMKQGGIDQSVKTFKFGPDGVPTSYRSKFRNALTKEFTDELNITVAWEEVANIHLPSRISRRLAQRRRVNGRDYFGVVEFCNEMKWQSINEEINKQQFDPSRYNSIEKISLLLDPKEKKTSASPPTN